MKNKTIYITFAVGSIIILLSAFYANEKLMHISTTLVCLYGLLLNPSIVKKDKSKKWYSWFIRKDNSLDEREKLIMLKSNQIAFSIGLMSAMIFYLMMKDSIETFTRFRYSWFYWCLGITMLTQSISGFIYTKFVKLEL